MFIRIYFQNLIMSPNLIIIGDLLPCFKRDRLCLGLCVCVSDSVIANSVNSWEKQWGSAASGVAFSRPLLLRSPTNYLTHSKFLYLSLFFSHEYLSIYFNVRLKSNGFRLFYFLWFLCTVVYSLHSCFSPWSLCQRN